MPRYDYECYSCYYVWEVIEPSNRNKLRRCPKCALNNPNAYGYARRIISKVSVKAPGDSNPEIKASADVVDPTESPEAAEFVKHRTRGAQKAYMKRHDLRFLQDGEKPQRPEPVDIGKLAEKIVTKRRKDEAIKI